MTINELKEVITKEYEQYSDKFVKRVRRSKRDATHYILHATECEILDALDAYDLEKAHVVMTYRRELLVALNGSVHDVKDMLMHDMLEFGSFNTGYESIDKMLFDLYVWLA